MSYDRSPYNEMQSRQSDVFTKYGAFFAFSTEQLNEQIDPNRSIEQYCRISFLGGCIVPKENSSSMLKELETVHAEYHRKNLEINGLETIIEHELSNHECYYTGDISDAVDALGAYDVTPQMVRDVYLATRHEYD